MNNFIYTVITNKVTYIIIGALIVILGWPGIVLWLCYYWEFTPPDDWIKPAVITFQAIMIMIIYVLPWIIEFYHKDIAKKIKDWMIG